MRWKLWACLALLPLLTGCIIVEEQLVLNADGSGEVTIRTTGPTNNPMQAMVEGRLGGDGGLPFPPTHEEAAQKLFPGVEGIEVEATPVPDEAQSSSTLNVTARFKDINALMKTAYGQAHSLAIDQQGDRMRVRLRPGLDFVAGSIKNNPYMEANGAGGEEMKKQIGKFRYQFTLTTPGDVQAQGAKVEGKKAVWTIARTDFGEDEAKFGKAVRQVMTASFPASAAKFKPASPPRLDLEPFDKLVETVVEQSGAAVDEDQVRKAAQFIPLAMNIRRTFDISGEGWAGSEATLTAAWLLPRGLVPRSWGEITIEEALDDQGNDLRSKDEEGRMTGMSVMNTMAMARGDGEKKTEGDLEKNIVQIQLKVPAGVAKKLKRIAGSATARYGGSRRLIKLPAAIAADRIMDPEAEGMVMHEGEMLLSHPALAESNLGMTVQRVMRQAGATYLMIEVKGDPAALGELRVFDAKGEPWMAYSRDDNTDESRTFVIVGSPQAPLSLAMLVTVGGQEVKLPFELKDLPIEPNRSREPAKE